MKCGWESYLFCLRGDTSIVYDSKIQVYFVVSNLGGELVCIFVDMFIFHTCVDVFVECSRKTGTF